MAKKKGTSAVTMVILLLLILGLAGFGVTNFGGSVRAVATVGSAEIESNDYARAIDAQLRQLQRQTGQPFTFQQARAFGIDRVALAQLISNAALEDEARSLGISVADETVGREIQRLPDFRSASGNFDRQIYEMSLRNTGQNIDDFETRIRSDIAEQLLQSSVTGGLNASDIYVDTLFNYARETRDVTWARLSANDLEAPVPLPSQSQLSAYHADNPDAFTRPETKVIRYAVLTPETLAGNLEVDDEQLRTLYDARIDEYQQPERRLVERLVFSDEAQASEAKARIDAGEISFDDLVRERGLELTDVDLGDLTEADLGAAAEGIFALAGPGVAGPLPSDLGPALFRMNGILAPQETSFEEARAELSAEAALDRARRLILDLNPQVEDLLAGGADMSVLAERTDMEAGQIEWNSEVFDGIAAYAAFRQAAAATQPGDFPEIIQLDDGGIASLTVEEVLEPSLRPFDLVRTEVEQAWRRAETQSALAAMAERLAGEVRGGLAFAAMELDIEVNTGLDRVAFVEGTPPDFIETLFDMDAGELRVLGAAGDAWLVQLNAINPPDLNAPDLAAERDRVVAGMALEMATSVAAAYSQALVEKIGVELNQSALNAVHAHMP